MHTVLQVFETLVKSLMEVLLRSDQMKSINYVIKSIADETRVFESWSSEESNKRTNAALTLISEFERGTSNPTSLELGCACCLLVSTSSEFANHQHWKTIEDLYSGVKPESVKVAVLSLRDDYFK